MTACWLFLLACRTKVSSQQAVESDTATQDTAPLEDSPTLAIEIDEDGDGFNAEEDCNDQDAAIYPGALDLCGDDIDHSCTGFKDDALCSLTTEEAHHIVGSVDAGGFGKSAVVITNSSYDQSDRILIAANRAPTGVVYHADSDEVLSHIESETMPQSTQIGTRMFGTTILEPNAVRSTDINQDGFNDWIVSSPETDNTIGQVHIFTTANWLHPSQSIAWTNGSDTGKTMELIDWNADGILDVVIGDARSDLGSVDAGAIAIALSDSTMSGIMPISTENILTGEQTSDLFGSSVVNIGDINLDGHQDLAVGAPRSKGEAEIFHAGRVTVYLSNGTQGIDNQPDLTIDGTIEEGLFGSSIAVLGDVNNDGIQDLGIGARHADGSGMGYLVSSDSLLSCTEGCSIEDITFSRLSVEDPEGQFARSWIPLGDFNQDGVDDFGVGAKRANIEMDDTGALYLYFGPIQQNLHNQYHGRISGHVPNAQITVSTTVTDIDGDDTPDLILGGRTEQGTVDNGHIYILTHADLFR